MINCVSFVKSKLHFIYQKLLGRARKNTGRMLERKRQITKVGRITIGDHVYLGQGVTILCDVTIGDNTIVGAQSLVNKDLESNSVYAGNPVRCLGSIKDFDNKHERLLEIKPIFNKNCGHWRDCATEEERKSMKKQLSSSFGYILDEK